jgi:hypothetical protein
MPESEYENTFYKDYLNLRDLLKKDPKKIALIDNIISRLLKHEKILQNNEEKKLYKEMIASDHKITKSPKQKLEDLAKT